MYFVTLCTTASAPSTSGRCRAGVANVLSTTTRAPCSWVTAHTAPMSTIFSSGFDGVSIQTSFVAGVSAADSASRSPRSTVENARPQSVSTFDSSR